MEFVSFDNIENGILLIVFLYTVFVGGICFYFIKYSLIRVLLTLLLFACFIYSGYGIAYPEVDNRFVYYYVLYITCLVIPFLCFTKTWNRLALKLTYTKLDIFLYNHYGPLKWLTFFYFFLLFVPLVYPEFKLFNVFTNGFSGLVGFYDKRVAYNNSVLISITDALKIFVLPFFLVFVTVKQMRSPQSKLPLFLFVLAILFEYMRYEYLGRYKMMIYLLLILSLKFVIKGGDFHLKKKHVITLLAILFSLIPFLYMYTFIRIGADADWDISFGGIIRLFMASETYYPIFYNHILTSSFLAGLTSLQYVLWLMFLPIPSFLFPMKPTLESDTFTYSLTGLSYGETGYSSFLPSMMGESFMFFGNDFFWIHALLLSFIIVFIIKYLLRNRMLLFCVFYFCVFIVTIGRVGGTSFMPLLINGTISIVLLNFFVTKKL